ncbi:mitosis inhibitor protein kinase swe1 [Tieghemiomyces parasiticus]|uniref:Mitosis inhibitor protein kinase swe1 n=1 Tax=Tieghemiomyces parasiticus TaxID=78921 RepID=A0A9W8AA51_9FUNG|nr:mitosis inhibitor protein kinase swe1 [Tieghemiomyces parasiticus]
MTMTPQRKAVPPPLASLDDGGFFATPTLPASRTKRRATATGLRSPPVTVFSPAAPRLPAPATDDGFFTPQPAKLVKPVASAFHSTGLLSKRNRPKPAEVATPTFVPDTPCKKTPARFAFTPTAAATPNARLTFGSPLALPPKKHRIPSLECLKIVKKPHLAPASPFDAPRLAAGSPSPPPPPPFPPASPTRSPVLGQPGCRHSDASLDDAFTVYGGGSRRDSWLSLTGSPTSVSSLATLHSYAAHDSPTQFARTTDWVLGVQTTTTTATTTDARDMMLCDEDSSPRPSASPPPPPFVTAHAHFLTPAFFERTRHDPHRLPLDDPGSTAPAPDYLTHQFIVLDQIGAGAFSEVFKVQDRVTGCLYAVKKARYPFGGRKDRLGRLEEVQTMWALGAHPHVVQLYNAWEQHGHLYLQTELMENGSLDTFLDAYGQLAPLAEDRAWHILAQVAAGLRHVHDAHVLHLDVKPANVFISDDWSLKLGDFGLSTHEAAAGEIRDREGDREYMAPEVLGGTYGKPADLFSLGLLLLEVTANVILPDNGPAWQKLRTGDLSDVRFDVATSTDLVALIRALLAPLPGDRPTVEAVLAHPRVVQALAAAPGGSTL